jgi:predicted molibdopterin-dependent oxidoreductase YjgC
VPPEGDEVRIAAHPVLVFEHGPRVPFTFDGRAFVGYEGEAIAAALHAAGVRVLSQSRTHHRPRGLYCAIGNCSSCLMVVDGEPNVRVCVEPLSAGMRIETQLGKGVLGGEGSRP